MLKLVNIKEEGAELQEIRTLFKQYETELDENICFQSFEKELENPLVKYGEPKGRLILAYWNNEIAGTIALTPLEEAGVCEMKRLYVKPAFRSFKIGGQLVDQILQQAQEAGYTKMKLDTLTKLVAACELYRKRGFQETTPYYNNPLSNVVYFEKQL